MQYFQSSFINIRPYGQAPGSGLDLANLVLDLENLVLDLANLVTNLDKPSLG